MREVMDERIEDMRRTRQARWMSIQREECYVESLRERRVQRRKKK